METPSTKDWGLIFPCQTRISPSQEASHPWVWMKRGLLVWRCLMPPNLLSHTCY